MKVIELCLSDGVGGLELYAVRTAVALKRLGHHCVAVVRPGTMLAQRMADEGVEVVPLANRSRLLPLPAARRLAAIIDAQEADVLHMHWGKDLFLAALAKRLAKRPVRLVYTRQMALTRPKKDWYHRFVYGEVDLYLTITALLQEQARRFLPLPPEQIQLLYYGVRAPEPMEAARRTEVRRQLGVPEGVGLAIGLVGRVEEKKGQHLLVEAVRRLREEGLSIHATLIGPAMDEGYAEGLRRRVDELNLGDAVAFHGPHKNPIDIIGAFDVAVLATEMETFGLVLIEAMRTGVCVIGTEAGGVPEIIDDGETGLMFPPNDAEALSERLFALYRDPAHRRTLASAGKAKADRLFSEEEHYRTLERLLVSERNSPRQARDEE